MYWLILEKDRFKFSSSHFTLFDEHHAERLHGHNYYVSLKLGFRGISKETQLAVSFDLVKSSLKKICDELDERVLLPKNSSYLKITEEKGYSSAGLEVLFQKKRYVFPKEDVALLEVSNISSEALAKWVGEKFLASLPKDVSVDEIELSIEETRGQRLVWSSHN